MGAGLIRETVKQQCARESQVVFERIPAAVKNVISMDDHIVKDRMRSQPLRDRRYAIRFPFAADAAFLDLESGARTDGVTSDISLGGCFVCTSKPLAAKSRVRVTLTRKDQSMEALAVVRIVKPRVGMGIEFVDVDTKSGIVLERWIEQLRRGH
jgi:PilZ domain